MPKRVCRSKVSVAPPRCGGKVMLMLSPRSLPTTMSQNWRLVLRPAPSSSAQATAGPTLGAVGAGVVDRWAPSATPAADTHAATSTIRISHARYISGSIALLDSSTLPMAHPHAYPQRIVCLTEETTETLYRLGAGDRVVGVSGYTARPPEARQKPKVSAFLSARIEKIEALRPDLILAFSDLQADIVRDLLRRGHTVVGFNQRHIADILQMIRMLGG